MKRIVPWMVRIVVLLLCAAVLLPSVATSMGSVAVVRTLPFGWLNFLKRTVPEVTVNWSGIGMVVLCSAVILACLHSLLSALTQKRFPFRWSVSIFASIWLLFCLIIAVAGLSRTISLLQSEKWYEPRSGNGDLRRASMHARMALSESGNDLKHLRRLLLDATSIYGRPLWEEFEFLLCSPAQSQSPCIVVIPKEPKVRERVGFSIVTEADSEDSIPMAKLHERLAKLRAPASR